MNFKASLEKLDSQILSAFEEEEKRIREEIILIASENYPSKLVLNITGSIFSKSSKFFLLLFFLFTSLIMV